MKKFYMILAALLIGSVSFAQKATVLTEKISVPQSNQTRETGWYGATGCQYYYTMEATEGVVIIPSSYTGATTVGDQLTKVKFGCYQYSQDASYNGTSFTLKVYEGLNPDQSLTTQGSTENIEGVLGTCVRTQNITATLNTENEITLTEPYTITSTPYCVVLIANAKTAILCTQTQISNIVALTDYQADPSVLQLTAEPAGNYMMIYPADGEDPATLNENAALLYTDNTRTNIAAFETVVGFQIYIQGSGAYVENSDISAGFMNGETAPYQDAETNITLTAGQSLSVYPYIMNGGPDATSNNVEVNLTFNNNSVYTETYPLSGQYALSTNQFMFIYYWTADETPTENSEFHNDYTLTAAEMDEMNLPATFDVCLTITYAGVDNTPGNNTACLHVTRPTTSVAENLASEVSVYPNPANDMFTVANAEGATIVVVNSLGQVVASIENAASNQTIDASNFANGTYFVKVNESVVKINVVK